MLILVGNLWIIFFDFRMRFFWIEFVIVEWLCILFMNVFWSGIFDVFIVMSDMLLLDNKMFRVWSECVFVVLFEDYFLVVCDVVYWIDFCDEIVLLSYYDFSCEFEDFIILKFVFMDDWFKID